MALFVISCWDKPNSLELRMATRPHHLDYAHNHPEVKVQIGGPYLDEAGAMCGSMLLVEAPDRAAVSRFVANDPYGKAGLFANVDVRAYRLTVGGFADH